MQNQCRTFARPPMKRVRWSEQDHLRRTCRRCEMHWSRIDCYHQLCRRNQRCQCKQVCPSREVDDFLPCVLGNGHDMLLLIGGWPTGQDNIEVVILSEMVNDLCPSRRVPQFLPACRPGMQNDVPLFDLRITSNHVEFFLARLRQLQMRSGGSSANAERFKQGQIVVDRVHFAHTYPDEIGVKAGTRPRLVADAIRSDASARAGQKRKKSRAIV